MKPYKYFVALGFLISILLTLHQEVFAAGTPAGTVISTRAKATFQTRSGAAVDSAFSNTVSVTVLQVAVVNITPASGAQTTNGDSVNVDYAFKVTNSGNGMDTLKFSNSSTQSFTVTYYHDANGNGTLDASELVSGAVVKTTPLRADSFYNVIMRVFVPKNPTLNNQVDVSTTAVKSGFDGTKTTAFTATTTVHTAFFNVTNSMTVSPTNPGAGADVTYTFTFTNTGNIAATGVTFSDVISAPLSYVSGTGTGFVPPSGNTAVWNIGTINPGATVTVTLTLLVAPGTANGTVISNSMNVTYTTPGPVTHSISSNTPYAAVGVTRSVSITPITFTTTAEMEDTVKLFLTVKNSGNSKDVLEMTSNSGHGYTWTYFKDANLNGVLDGTDPLLTNTNGSGGVDTDSLAAQDSMKIFARLIVPTGIATDQLLDNSTLTVTSAADATKWQSTTVALTINIPLLQLIRSVAPQNTRYPGETNTYTTTYQNTGHGKAYNVQIVEREPDSCSYVANSTYLNGIQKTDLSDADSVTVTTVNGRKVITVSLGTLQPLSPGVPGAIKFDAIVH